jgi:hypothetical protein
VASVPGQGVETGWVYLAKEQQHWPLAEVISEALCDQVVTPAPIHINAGDLIGHLGLYWQVEDPTQVHQQVHIEVFCDDALPTFLAGSREVALKITDFSKLPLLRIDRGVKLYEGPSVNEEGVDARQTAVVQIYSQAARVQRTTSAQAARASHGGRSPAATAGTRTSRAGCATARCPAGA